MDQREVSERVRGPRLTCPRQLSNSCCSSSHACIYSRCMYSVPAVCQKLRNWRETGVIRHAPTSNTQSHVHDRYGENCHKVSQVHQVREAVDVQSEKYLNRLGGVR